MKEILKYEIVTKILYVLMNYTILKANNKNKKFLLENIK